MPNTITRKVALAAAAMLALALTACSTPGDNAGAPSESSGSRPVSELNIGFFTPTNANSYASSLNESAVATAEGAGAKITVLDANFDAQTQINQMQQALDRKSFNAWVVVAADGVRVCNTVKDAIAAGIPVMIATGHVCNDDEIGQIGFVGVQGADAYADWLATMLDENEDAKLAFLAGPPLVDLVQSMKTELDSALADHPGVELVDYQNTDWTPEQSFTLTQDLLRAHPDVDVIATTCGCSTAGVVQALKQAGVAGDIEVYDMMGGQAVVDQIAEGSVTMSLPGLPASEGRLAVENLIDFWTGEPTFDVLNPADDSPVPGGPYVTADNATEYVAETP